ncbi:MAG: hypothetical protein Q8Q38_00035 [bacterium]|nr:hypothetical protein [bacterium]MDZ4231780.1 hypothetical protein [Candidatus Pacearchaeota archaeon]
MELSPSTQQLITKYRNWVVSKEAKTVENTIEVDEVASKVAAFYEKIRGVVDWREEHLLRKTAIERMLKRRLLMTRKPEEVAEPLLSELVRGGHFPNGRIPTSAIPAVQEIITKYLFLIEHAKKEAGGETKIKDPRSLESWLLGIAASEIEETLSPPLKELALREFAALRMQSRITADLPESEFNFLILIAVERALFQIDDTTLNQHLLFKFIPDWDHPSHQTLLAVSERIWNIRKQIEDLFHHPLAEYVYRYVEKHDTPYLLLGDIVEQHREEVLDLTLDPAATEGLVREAYEARLQKLKKKLRRAGIYSTLSIFVSKVVLAVAIEVPLDRYLVQHPSLLPLALSVSIPPLLMFFLVMGTRPSSEENFQRLLLETMALFYEKEPGPPHEIRLPKRRGGFVRAMVSLAYLSSFLVSFGALIWILNRLGFTVPSMLIFLFFVSLVAFAGTVIRQRAKELQVTELKEGFFFGLFDLFFLPIVRAGKWLSRSLMRYNAVSMFFNVFLEIPLQIFIEFIEQWRAFLKEKKEEIH